MASTKIKFYVVTEMPEYEETVGPFTRAAAVRRAEKQTKAGHESYVEFYDPRSNARGWLHPYGGVSPVRQRWRLF